MNKNSDVTSTRKKIFYDATVQFMSLSSPVLLLDVFKGLLRDEILWKFGILGFIFVIVIFFVWDRSSYLWDVYCCKHENHFLFFCLIVLETKYSEYALQITKPIFLIIKWHNMKKNMNQKVLMFAFSLLI